MNHPQTGNVTQEEASELLYGALVNHFTRRSGCTTFNAETIKTLQWARIGIEYIGG